MPGPQEQPQPAKAPPVLLKKRCKNCPKFFQQTKPWQDFCSTPCRRQFNKFGSAFGSLKETVAKMIGKEAAAIVAKEFDRYVSGKDFRRTLAASGFIHKSQLIKKPIEQTPLSMLRRINALEARLMKVIVQLNQDQIQT